jgi:hypothetical protein
MSDAGYKAAVGMLARQLLTVPKSKREKWLDDIAFHAMVRAEEMKNEQDARDRRHKEAAKRYETSLARAAAPFLKMKSQRKKRPDVIKAIATTGRQTTELDIDIVRFVYSDLTRQQAIELLFDAKYN